MITAIVFALALPGVVSRGLILEGAKMQLKHPAKWTGEYFKIKYPLGDPPADKGACTDVVIRAFRHDGVDLQKAIYEDAGLVSYPGIQKRDPNIDHRRCPNQKRYFDRFAQALPVDSDFEAGDVVYWKLDSNLDHVGIVSDLKGASGDPLVIHNLGYVAEQDVLHSWKVVGHYRWVK